MNGELIKYLGDSVVTTSSFGMPLKMLGAAAGAMGATIAQCMLLPHVLFSIIGNNFPIAFAKLLCPSRERLAEFWFHMAGIPQLKGSGL